jgi:hypothetical protein
MVEHRYIFDSWAQPLSKMYRGSAWLTAANKRGRLGRAQRALLPKGPPITKRDPARPAGPLWALTARGATLGSPNSAQKRARRRWSLASSAHLKYPRSPREMQQQQATARQRQLAPSPKRRGAKRGRQMGRGRGGGGIGVAKRGFTAALLTPQSCVGLVVLFLSPPKERALPRPVKKPSACLLCAAWWVLLGVSPACSCAKAKLHARARRDDPRFFCARARTNAACLLPSLAAREPCHASCLKFKGLYPYHLPFCNAWRAF